MWMNVVLGEMGGRSSDAGTKSVSEMTLPVVEGVRYVAPLREGGSLPAIVDASDGHTYVVKFRGAGQGARALVAEVIVAELAKVAGLPVPAPAIVHLADGFGKGEPDPEIQDILRGSIGSNFGLRYLPGAFGFDPAVDTDIDPGLAADVLWFDSFVVNVDRTPRNPNILTWRGGHWLIDHGASLYFHHGWRNWRARSQDPFALISDHVLLRLASDPRDADRRLRPRFTRAVLEAAVAAVPESWLTPVDAFDSEEEQREAYVTWLLERLQGDRAWVATATAAWQAGPSRYARRETHRVV